MTSADITDQLVIFNLGEHLCALETEAISEIIKMQPVSSIYHAPPYVTGVINLRGEIVTIIDLKVKLGIEPVETKENNIIIVLFRDESVGLLIDEVEDINQVDVDCLEPPPPNLNGLHENLMKGVYKMDGALVSVLNVPEVLDKEGSSARAVEL